MRVESVGSITEYLKLIEDVRSAHFDPKLVHRVKQDGDLLYRGQSQDFPLLPKIARGYEESNCLDRESYLLKELMIRGGIYRDFSKLDIWGVIDFSSALWACNKVARLDE